MNGDVFHLYVKTNAPEFAVLSLDAEQKIIKISVKSKAIKGKANQEIIKEFKSLFDVDIFILKGTTSNRKLVTFSGLETGELLKRLKK